LDPKESARLLAAVSASLLPTPGLRDVILESGEQAKFAETVLQEMRSILRLTESDRSTSALTKLYALLSDEMTEAALSSTKIADIQNRLGEKGWLHPSKYRVEFNKAFSLLEPLGERKPNISEIVSHPDHVRHLNPSEENRPQGRITVSTKSVVPQKSDNRFVMIVVSTRIFATQSVYCAFRAYRSAFKFDEDSDPLELLEAFVAHYGLRFRLGNVTSTFLLNETVEIDDTVPNYLERISLIGGEDEHRFVGLLMGTESSLRTVENRALSRVDLAFIVDMTEYIATLRKHGIPVGSRAEEQFLPVKARR
jgi:hypothetical protein